MRVTYKPAGDTERQWDFTPGRVRANEAELIEKRWGGHYDNWAGAVQSGSVRARRILLWHLLKQEHHTLRYEDTPDFYTEELVVEHSRDELEKVRDRILKADLDPDDREQALTAIDIAITEAIEAEELGKAHSRPAENVSG